MTLNALQTIERTDNIWIQVTSKKNRNICGRTKTESWDPDTKQEEWEGGGGVRAPHWEPKEGWEGEGGAREEGWTEPDNEMGFNDPGLQDYMPHQLGENTPPPGIWDYRRICPDIGLMVGLSVRCPNVLPMAWSQLAQRPSLFGELVNIYFICPSVLYVVSKAKIQLLKGT